MSDEDLLRAFYDQADAGSLEELARRLDPVLARMAFVILIHRTGAGPQSLGEWFVDERLQAVWTYVNGSRLAGFGHWPRQRLSALAWLVPLLCLEMDRHLGLKPPF